MMGPMELSPEQKQAVASWVQEGAALAEVQNRLHAEYGIQMTYMDVRFLVDDLNIELPKEPEPEPEEQPEEAAATVEPTAGVTVEVDTVVQPGAIASGTVTFSDGQDAKWLIDQMGRPSLIPPHEGYRPSQEDVQEFQVLLNEALQKKGF